MLLPAQIGFELLFYTHPYKHPGVPFCLGQQPCCLRGVDASELALFVDYLWREGGYLPVDRHDNPYCSHCSELLMVRLPQTRSCM